MKYCPTFDLSVIVLSYTDKYWEVINLIYMY